MTDLDTPMTTYHEHLRVSSLDLTSFLCDYCEDIWPCETMAHKTDADRLAEALRGLMVTRYRYVHQTGGQPTTEDDMDTAARAAIDALHLHDEAER